MVVTTKTKFESVMDFSCVLTPRNIPLDSLSFINTKLISIEILANDLPVLADAHFKQEFKRSEDNPEVATYNSIFQSRIASSCESLCSSVYGAGEIAAKFIGPRFHPQMPNNFRGLKERLKAGDLKDYGLNPTLFDFEGHELILAARSETSHYSSVFVAMPSSERRTLSFKTLSEDMQRVETSSIPLEIFVSSALASIENLKTLICIFFDNVVFPQLNLDIMIRGNVSRDSRGIPIVKNGLLSPLPDISVRDHIIRCGLEHLL
ncbi:hypothetical protein JMK10_02940 [Rhodovulum sulfidophilum]|uniref:hypothetical protein n=1 Tax=Rhodovulum sulfidophilum TaxID=35806 RepID=UPI00192134C0|nr:hypothetical protein [Rhodovulum sulfidophilum]MBL3576244.1 hypothetical protein [Rhodovulum sulfidophilum]MCE8432705.1 hypothetical protein [Rhodovulum sulfidophilum]MCF4115790.1 hypothetical protein [Rhodovulum sulfidophilum]